MIPLANANQKDITIISDPTVVATGDSFGSSRFTLSKYGTGFALVSEDTTAISNCAGKAVSFDFNVG